MKTIPEAYISTAEEFCLFVFFLFQVILQTPHVSAHPQCRTHKLAGESEINSSLTRSHKHRGEQSDILGSAEIQSTNTHMYKGGQIFGSGGQDEGKGHQAATIKDVPVKVKE